MIFDLYKLTAPLVTESLPYVQYKSVTISPCDDYIGIITDSEETGIIIIDRKSGQITRTITTNDTISHMSFNPKNSSRICSSGTILQYYRIIPSGVQIIPITGAENLTNSDVYNIHAWIDGEKLVAGTSRGELLLVSGHTVHSKLTVPFASHQNDSGTGIRSDCGVQNIIVEKTVVLVIGRCSYICVYELVSTSSATLSTHSKHELSLRYTVNISNAHTIHGSILYSGGTTSNKGGNPEYEHCYDLVISTESGLGHVYLPCPLPVDTLHNSSGTDTLDNSTGNADIAGLSAEEREAQVWISRGKDQRLQHNIDISSGILDIPMTHIFASYHSDKIISVALSQRTSTMLTASEDGVVSVMDYSKTSGNVLLSQNILTETLQGKRLTTIDYHSSVSYLPKT